MATIGRTLPKMISVITNLILVTRGPKRQKLIEQQTELSSKLQKLIDKNVPQDTKEYKEFILEIKKANRKIKEALDDKKNVTEATETIERVIRLLSRVASCANGGVIDHD